MCDYVIIIIDLWTLKFEFNTIFIFLTIKELVKTMLLVGFIKTGSGQAWPPSYIVCFADPCLKALSFHRTTQVLGSHSTFICPSASTLPTVPISTVVLRIILPCYQNHLRACSHSSEGLALRVSHWVHGVEG